MGCYDTNFETLLRCPFLLFLPLQKIIKKIRQRCEHRDITCFHGQILLKKERDVQNCPVHPPSNLKTTLGTHVLRNHTYERSYVSIYYAKSNKSCLLVSEQRPSSRFNWWPEKASHISSGSCGSGEARQTLGILVWPVVCFSSFLSEVDEDGWETHPETMFCGLLV